MYDGPARDALLAFKLGGERRAATAIGTVMAEAAIQLDAEVVTAVPGTRKSVSQRGFNPAEALAKVVAARKGIPYARMLRKVRETADQAGLSKAERERNLDGAFAARAAGTTAIRVDDVRTTGATATACARALASAGVVKIDVLTFALAI
ncbi:MAG: ComF family protein [Actinomycetota bacterium]